MDEETPYVDIPLAWIGAEELPVHLLNQFVCQFSQDEFILTLGQTVPPAIMGVTPEERAQQIEGIAYVPVKPIARLALTRARLVELIATLQANLGQYDQHKSDLKEQMKGGEGA